MVLNETSSVDGAASPAENFVRAKGPAPYWLKGVARHDEDHAHHFQADAYRYLLSNNTIRTRDQTRIIRYMPEAHPLSSRYLISYLSRKALVQGGAWMYAHPYYLCGHEDKTQSDEGALDHLAARFQVRNMIDIGCGPGGMVYYALSKCIKVVGVDADPNVARFPMGGCG